MSIGLSNRLFIKKEASAKHIKCVAIYDERRE